MAKKKIIKFPKNIWKWIFIIIGILFLIALFIEKPWEAQQSAQQTIEIVSVSLDCSNVVF